MSIYTKRVMTLAVLAAAALTAVDGFVPSRSEPSATSIVASRFLALAQAAPSRQAVDGAPLRRQAALAASLSPAEWAKADRLDLEARAFCRDQTWPHLAAACLTSAGGSPAKQPSRYVTVVREARADGTELARVAAPALASR
jgi:hypothetical protein